MAQKRPDVQAARKRAIEEATKGLHNVQTITKKLAAEFNFCVYCVKNTIYCSYKALVVDKRTGEMVEREQHSRILSFN